MKFTFFIGVCILETHAPALSLPALWAGSEAVGHWGAKEASTDAAGWLKRKVQNKLLRMIEEYNHERKDDTKIHFEEALPIIWEIWGEGFERILEKMKGNSPSSNWNLVQKSGANNE